jgi:hypothetical protein
MEIVDTGNKVKCKEKLARAFEAHTVSIPGDGKWNIPMFQSIANYNTPKIYYFAVMDCEH